MNIVLLRGRLSRPPEQRTLPSGDRLVAYELTVDQPGARAESVPVVWHEPPASAVDLEVGSEVVAIGRVRRRFFRAGGATQSRTEVVADAVIRGRHAKRVARAMAAALGRVDLDVQAIATAEASSAGGASYRG